MNGVIFIYSMADTCFIAQVDCGRLALMWQTWCITNLSQFPKASPYDMAIDMICFAAAVLLKFCFKTLSQLMC